MSKSLFSTLIDGWGIMGVWYLWYKLATLMRRNNEKPVFENQKNPPSLL
jgi:hypothetical protein